MSQSDLIDSMKSSVILITWVLGHSLLEEKLSLEIKRFWYIVVTQSKHGIHLTAPSTN